MFLLVCVFACLAPGYCFAGPKTETQRQSQVAFEADSDEEGIEGHFAGSFHESFDSAIEGDTKSLQAQQAKAEGAAKPEEKAAAEKAMAKLDAFVDERVAKSPESLAVQNSGARFALQQGDTGAALERSERAVGLAERTGEAKALGPALDTRAMARYASRDYPGACADARAALKRDEKDFLALQVSRFSCGRGAGATGAESGSAGVAGRPGIAAWAQGRAPAPAQWVSQGSPLLAHTPREWAERQKRSPTRAYEPVARSMRSYKKGDLAGALALAESAVKLDAADPMAWAQRGLVRRDLKDYNGAVTDLTRALALGMVWSALYHARAIALLAAGQQRAALNDLDAAIDLEPKNPVYRHDRGRAKKELGYSPDDFLSDLRSAAELDPRRFAPAYEQAKAEAAALAARAAAAGEPGRAERGSGGAGAGRSGEGSGTGAGKPGSRGFMESPWFVRAALGSFLVFLVIAGAFWLRGRAGSGAQVLPTAREEAAGPPAGLATGAILGGSFLVIRRLGEGGMGVVYEAQDTKLGRRVAIKKMLDALKDVPQERDRCLKEARALALLKHPAIVGIHALLEEGGEAYLVCEYVDGETVYGLIERQGRIPPAESLAIVQDVCAGLNYAHSKGVIHRDLKPANIMLEDGKVKIMDFGLARVTASAGGKTQTSLVYGTPAYMAPEAWAGQVSRESDYYSLAVCVYEMLTGRRPFDGPSLLQDKLDARFPPLGAYVPGKPGLDDFFKKALASVPERRFHSGHEFWWGMSQALG